MISCDNPMAPRPADWNEAGAARRFRPPERAASTELRRMSRDLRHAAETGAFTLALQPRVALADFVVLGAEASISWPHRKPGMTARGRIGSLLESCGLARLATEWRLEAACQEARQWGSHPWHARQPADPFGISVDVSSRLLEDGSLLVLVADALARSGLAGSRLEIELPESELVDCPIESLYAVSALRDRGVGLALDHFGGVSASLLPLARLPFTTLKLDRALVRDLPTDREAEAAVEASIAFAHKLETKVVAIGVETEAQAACLIRLGCDEAQGKLFGGVMTPDLFRARLAKASAWPLHTD